MPLIYHSFLTRRRSPQPPAVLERGLGGVVGEAQQAAQRGEVAAGKMGDDQ